MPIDRAARSFWLWIDRLSSVQAILLGYGIVLLLATADYNTRAEASLSVFYLFPVMIVAWRSSTKATIIMSLVSALVWEVINIFSGTRFPDLWIYFWNPGSRFAFYLVVALLLRKIRAVNVELSRLSSIDPLTGVKNRRVFIESLDIEIARHHRNEQPLSVAFIDLDNFKQVNDTLGHQTGDELLTTVAATLRAHLRKSDVIGRIGGDEFAILMPETNGEGAQAALSIARDHLHVAMSKLGVPVTFSAGIVSGQSKANADQILHYADALMYEVKQNGRDNIRQRELKDL
jgi:diguanylate cyclase (GGDEF)-like protein